MIDTRKQAVSIRMNVTDIRKVKQLAKRLGVRDSDVIRFAVKSMLTKLGPLYDPQVHGRNLLPVFVEYGGELLRFFDIDAAKLEAIINSEVEAERRVDREDVKLLALTGMQEPYAALKLSELERIERPRQSAADLLESLRQYLYAKYVYRQVEGGDRPRDGEASHDPVRLALAVDQEIA